MEALAAAAAMAIEQQEKVARLKQQVENVEAEILATRFNAMKAEAPTTGTWNDEISPAGSAVQDRPAKRYPCRYRDSHGCEKTFITSGYASRHSKIHTAKKAVHCTYPACHKKFTRADNMKQHLETHFKDKLISSSSITCETGGEYNERETPVEYVEKFFERKAKGIAEEPGEAIRHDSDETNVEKRLHASLISDMFPSLSEISKEQIRAKLETILGVPSTTVGKTTLESAYGKPKRSRRDRQDTQLEHHEMPHEMPLSWTCGLFSVDSDGHERVPPHENRWFHKPAWVQERHGRDYRIDSTLIDTGSDLSLITRGVTKSPGLLPVKRLISRTEHQYVKNVRRVLAVTINNHAGEACPDSGSSENIMQEDWARDHKLKIRRTPNDRRKLFELGNGTSVRAVGRVYVKVAIPQAAPSSVVPSKRKEWFYVFEKCPVPIILGMPFLEKNAIFTTNSHLLKACPKAYDDIDSVLWIGSPRNQIQCSIDGRRVVATADTGSDLNLMSFEHAKRDGHWIDDRPEVRRRLQFGDGSISETMGQVYINNFRLDWRSPPNTLDPGGDALVFDEKSQYDDQSDTDAAFAQYRAVFHVLPALPCDIILGRPLLEATGAFGHKGIQFFSSESRRRRKKNLASFNVVIDKGRKWKLFQRRTPTPLPINEDKSLHDNEQRAHRYRLSQMEDEIRSLVGLAKQEKLDATTRLKSRWETRHREWETRQGMCAFCT